MISQGPFALLLRNGARRCGSLTPWVGQSPGVQLQAPLPPLPHEEGLWDHGSSSSLTCSMGPAVCAGQESGAGHGGDGKRHVTSSIRLIHSVHPCIQP